MNASTRRQRIQVHRRRRLRNSLRSALVVVAWTLTTALLVAVLAVTYAFALGR